MSEPTPKTSLPTAPMNAKPVKLRAACNHCFSAKVRCDGNKQGCKRCCEKHLICTYSESRVGKVVGKRRKRPLDDSVGNVNSETWVVNSNPAQSIPSPAATNSSEDSAKAQCTTTNWTSFIASGEEQGFLNFEESLDSLQSADMGDNRSFSMSSDMAFFGTSGLPTPALSPPQFRYLSPAALETRPVSRQTSSHVDSSRLLPPRQSSSASRTTEPPVSEDEETVCIKLLAHLKKHNSNEHQSREAQIELLKKSNAAVRRIARSKTIRLDYTCQLLLSSILVHLVGLCETVCSKKGEVSKHLDSSFLQDQIHFEATSEYFEDNCQPQTQHFDGQEGIKSVIQEAATLTSTIGDMLKRKPLNGFQTLGRHETLHIGLEQRLQRVLSTL